MYDVSLLTPESRGNSAATVLWTANVLPLLVYNGKSGMPRFCGKDVEQFYECIEIGRMRIFNRVWAGTYLGKTSPGALTRPKNLVNNRRRRP